MNVPSRAPLAFGGAIIHDRGDMLSLTDMWRAAGADTSRAPAEWMRSADAERFISFVLETLNMGISHDEAIKIVRGGRNPGTWAHWQIALAYAKYLSPEFHMWCNTVVRERMEGKSISTANLPADVLELISRTDGISRMLSHKVTEMEKGLAQILGTLPALVWHEVEAALASDPRRAVLNYVSVRQLLDEAKALPRGRNSLNRSIGNDLRSRALMATPPAHLCRCPHTGVWLFPRDFAGAYMRERGLGLVNQHNNRVTGQGSLPLSRQ